MVRRRIFRERINMSKDLKCHLAKVYDEEIGLTILSKKDILLSPPVWVEPKYDGIRSVGVIDGDNSKFLSRKTNEFPNIKFILEAIRKCTGEDHFVFDGEVFLNNWNTTLSLVSTDRDNLTDEQKKQIENIRFIVFDCIPLESFKSGRCDVPLETRRLSLKQIVSQVNEQMPHIKLEIISHKIANTHDEVMSIYEMYLEEGYEGAMIKYPNAPYSCNRNKYWLKIKPEMDLDATIISVVEGKKKNKGKMGAFKILLDDGVYAKIGTGFTDEQRQYMWDNKDKIVGKRVEFRVQKEKVAVASVRNPRFLRIREDLS